MICDFFRMGKKPRDKASVKHVGKQRDSHQSETTPKSSRKSESSLNRILSQISHPQMPHESLQDKGIKNLVSERTEQDMAKLFFAINSQENFLVYYEA